MAEILIRLGADHADQKAWRYGMPVAVKPDGHKWGKLETWPKFAVIQVSDLSVKELEAYLEPDEDVNELTSERTMVGLRKWKFDLADAKTPPAVDTAAKAGTIAKVTQADIADCIKLVRRV